MFREFLTKIIRSVQAGIRSGLLFLRRHAKGLFVIHGYADMLPYFVALFLGAVVLSLVHFTQVVPKTALAAAIKTITINDDGVRTQYVTSCTTAGQLLEEYGISLGDQDSISMDSAGALSEGDYIYIRRAMTVFLMESGQSGDSIESVEILSGTVNDALALSAFRSATGDIVSPPRTEPLSPGMVIQVDQVVREIVSETERVYYKLITQKDSSIEVGKTKVVTEGKEGEKTVNYEVVYVNGEETSRRKISEIITTAAVDKVVSEGTKIPATPKPTVKKTTAAPTRTKAPTASVQDDNKIVIGGKTYTYNETMVVTATAYTHTGNKTASGKWPKVGMMAVDRELLPFGTKVYVPGYGIAVAEDVGGFRGNQIDLFMDTYNECMIWGRKRNLTIYILE